jgi:hypothetical protein
MEWNEKYSTSAIATSNKLGLGTKAGIPNLFLNGDTLDKTSAIP